MNKILNYGLSLAVLAGTSFSMTSCIEETIPTNTITENLAHGSSKGKEALLWGMPTVLNSVGIIGTSYHFDWGYGSIMQIRDRMTGDVTRPYVGGYDWYANWAYNQRQGKSYVYPQFIWNSYSKFIQAANEMIKATPDPESALDIEKGYAGAGYAFRAMLYLDFARMYEFLPNEKTEPTTDGGNDVTNLTVPIVDENATEESVKNNPRATREKMGEFILSDLDKAEKYIPNLTENSRLLPHLACVYGLKARLYMWLEQYDKAAEYAAKAIKESGLEPMTESDCLNKQKGFNDISKWMWGDQLVKENDGVQTGIINWASWMCNETTFGYAAAGTFLQMDASMYKRIDDKDFRKKMWAPGPLYNFDSNGNPVSYTQYKSWYEDNCIDISNIYASYANWGQYESIKFRPNNGNMDDVNTGASTAYPLMRVEEMYFIQAEATAHTDASAGKALLEDFMKKYRDETYTCTATSKDDIIEEIVFQKRVELWGEGQTFFDIKRLNYSVTRKYDGTNFPASAQFNTNGRPAWMNLVIVQTEENNNAAVMGWNNPDPTGKY